MNQKLNPQQLEEWFESPVTEQLLNLLRMRLDLTFQMRASVFFPGEPNKTQEGKAMLIGEEGVLNDLIDAFQEQDLSQIHEAEESEIEQIRNTPVRRPSLN